jgi:WD40 repeat protein
MDDPDTATSILKSFVSVKGTKRPMDESEIMSTIGTFGTVVEEPVLLKYLTKFVDLRILRERDDAGHFELRHDALAAKIFEKFTLIDKELLEVRIFVENAYQAFNSRKTYLTQDDLDYIYLYEKRLVLSPSLNQFIHDSKDKLRSQQRALKRLTSIVAVMFLIIVAAGVQYYLNKKSSADTRELTAIALLQEKVDPMTSINTAFKIVSEDSLSTVSQGIILESFNNLLQDELDNNINSIPVELIPRSIPVTGSVLSMRTNKTGTSLFGWTDKNEVFTCPVIDSIIHSFIADNEIIRVEMSDNGRYFAVIYKNSRGDVFTLDGKKMFSFETTVNHLMNNRLVRFFTNDKYFLAAVKENNALIYDSTGTILFELTGHTGRINSLDISPDNRFVATASSDKSVLIWNFNLKTQLFSPYDTLIRYNDPTKSYADSILGPNDTIWSCEFNSTGKYILTASADSMIFIWDLDGKLLNEWFVFGMNSIHGAHSFWPLWNQRSTSYDVKISKSDIQNSYLNSYHKKVHDATFAANEKAVIASNYSYDNYLYGTKAGVFRTLVQYFDGFSWNFTDNTYSTNQYILKAQSQLVTEPIVPVEYLEISPDRQLFAAVSYNSKTIQIIAQDGYQMVRIPGSFPVFSKDGLYLLYVNNKEIRCLPVNLKEIYSLVYSKKVFGNMEKGRGIWKVL